MVKVKMEFSVNGRHIETKDYYIYSCIKSWAFWNVLLWIFKSWNTAVFNCNLCKRFG